MKEINRKFNIDVYNILYYPLSDAPLQRILLELI